MIHPPAAGATPETDMKMKRLTLALLLAILALPACQTTRRAAVSTFRVIDAPHVYLRRQLGMDNDDVNQTTTTTETNVAPDGSTYPQPYQQQTAPQPYPQQRQVVVAPPQRQIVTSPPPPQREIVTERERTREPEPESTPTPRVTSRASTSPPIQAHEDTTAAAPTSDKSSLPYAKPVPGKAGYVFSPYDKNGGYVDVTGFAPGSKVKDPYSGKVFLVP